MFFLFSHHMFFLNLLGSFFIVKHFLPILNAISAEDLKRELLQYLANRDCLMLFPGFLSYLDVQL